VGENGLEEIVETASEIRRREGWDLVICVTDLPLRQGKRPLVAAASPEERVAVVTVPAFGPARLRPRVREATLALVGELVEEALGEEGMRPSRLVRRRLAEVLTPITRTRRRDGVGTYYVMPPAVGHARLLAGMVRANKPWRALSGLSSAVVGAFATGAYALLTSTVWLLSGALGVPRLAGMMAGALLAVLAWLIVAHGLWERPRTPERRKDTALYNAATVLTLGTAVLCAYAVLFVLVFLVADLVIDGSVFRRYAGYQPGIADYALLGWFGASLATVAGALGSGLESIEEVREAAYGHRQRARQKADDADAERGRERQAA
jgi:hypothetical protein